MSGSASFPEHKELLIRGSRLRQLFERQIERKKNGIGIKAQIVHVRASPHLVSDFPTNEDVRMHAESRRAPADGIGAKPEVAHSHALRRSAGNSLAAPDCVANRKRLCTWSRQR